MSDKFPDRAEFALAGIRRGIRTFMLTSPFRHDSRIGWLTVPAGGEQFIFLSSDMVVLDDAGDEIPLPRPEFNHDVPSVFWA